MRRKITADSVGGLLRRPTNSPVVPVSELSRQLVAAHVGMRSAAWPDIPPGRWTEDGLQGIAVGLGGTSVAASRAASRRHKNRTAARSPPCQGEGRGFESRLPLSKSLVGEGKGQHTKRHQTTTQPPTDRRRPTGSDPGPRRRPRPRRREEAARGTGRGRREGGIRQNLSSRSGIKQSCA